MTRAFIALLFLIPAATAQKDPQQDQYFTLSGDFAASHILVSHKGAERARPDIERSKSEALERAEEALALLKEDPSRFEELARVYSDGPTGLTGGDLGSFEKGDMDINFQKALVDLEIGEITDEPVKTQFGYHIIRRNPMRDKRYAARALLLTYSGALPVGGLRDNFEVVPEEEALAEAEALQARLTTENFIEIAVEHSHLNLPTAFLGVFRKGQTAISNELIAYLEDMAYEEISEPIRLDVGFIIIQRMKVERLAGAQILITHIDSPKVPPDVLRIRSEARELAEKLCADLQKKPNKFAKLAKKHSDDISRVNGGLLPRWFAGYRDPAFEQAILELEPGEITSEPVETDDGFYILRRDPVE